MRYVLAVLALVALFAVPAMAYDGNVSKAALEKMGLSAMKTITDSEGALIRGSGFARAFGFSFASGGVPDAYGFSTPVKSGFSFSSGSGGFTGGGSIAFTK